MGASVWPSLRKNINISAPKNGVAKPNAKPMPQRGEEAISEKGLIRSTTPKNQKGQQLYDALPPSHQE